ncbi:hypothetical protein D3C81_1927460 [compost metagenome]
MKGGQRSLRFFAGLHNGQRAIQPIGHPQLALSGAGQQRQHADAFTRVGILARLQVDDLIQVRVVDHD